jgi:VanZ family protein
MEVVKRIARASAWLLLLVIVVLSLVPASQRPTTSVTHFGEHFWIFFAVGLAFGIGYAKGWWILTVGLTAFAGAIELAQLAVPGRHARASDFFVDAAAACVGIGLSCLASWLQGRSNSLARDQVGVRAPDLAPQTPRTPGSV